MRKIKKAMLALLLCAGLTACGDTVGRVSVEELLRAPQLNGQYSEVQRELNSYLGESAQLKYPGSGESSSPFLFGDWNGDGSEDAVVLYTSPTRSPNVHLAVLEQKGGSWVVTQEQEGLSAEVESLNAAQLQDRAGTQLLVGYGTSQGDQYLAVYSYADGVLTTVLQQTYSQYILADLTGSGAQDLVLISPLTEEHLQMQRLSSGENGLSLVQELDLAQGRFSGCAGLYASQSDTGERYLVVDGWTGGSGSYLASTLLRYNPETRQLEPFDPSGALYDETLRYNTVLRAADMNGDGAMEIPVELPEGAGGMVAAGMEKRLVFVGWQDYTSRGRTQKSYGLLDAEYGYYLALPALWKGQIQITGTDDVWEVRGAEDNSLYLSVCVLPLGQQKTGYTRIGVAGTNQVMVKIAPGGSAVNMKLLVDHFGAL